MTKREIKEELIKRGYSRKLIESQEVNTYLNVVLEISAEPVVDAAKSIWKASKKPLGGLIKWKPKTKLGKVFAAGLEPRTIVAGAAVGEIFHQYIKRFKQCTLQCDKTFVNTVRVSAMIPWEAPPLETIAGPAALLLRKKKTKICIAQCKISTLQWKLSQLQSSKDPHARNSIPSTQKQLADAQQRLRELNS